MANPLDTFVHDNLFGGNGPFRTKEVTVLSGEPAALAAGAVMGLVKTGAASAVAGANTGNGVMGAITKGILAKPGVYTLRIVEAAANAGAFEIKDPDGNVIGSGNVAVAFTSDHLNFTLADGATDFVVGDTFAITVAAGSGKARRLDVTAIDGTALPDHILADAVDASAADKVAVGYTCGEFNTRALSFDGATTVDTIVGGESIRDRLRKLGIFLVTSMNTAGVA
jgi:hypothetical protein